MSKPMGERLDERQARREGQGETGGETMRVPVNAYETDEALVVVAPLPGVMSDNVEIALEPGLLTISATMRAPAPKQYVIHEWHYGPFERTLDIPDGFGADARVSFGNGQLAISLAKGGSPTERRTLKPHAHG